MAEAKCGHAFHRLCVQEYLESAPVAAEGEQQQQETSAAAALGCPACFVPLTIDLSCTAGGEEGDERSSSKPTSAKKTTSNAANGKKGKKKRETQADGEGSSEDAGDESELDNILQVITTSYAPAVAAASLVPCSTLWLFQRTSSCCLGPLSLMLSPCSRASCWSCTRLLPPSAGG